MRIGVLALAVVLAVPLGGCTRAGYYLQSARGQLDLLSRRVAIEKLIEDPETSNELRDRLVTVNAIREFASAELGLPDNRSYRGYADLERAYVVWNVFAAPEFSVEPESWCFPIVGCVTYRGYFKEHSAQKFAAQLAADGLDVYVAGIAAYSTLGRFADPVLNTMLSGDDLYLAGLIFHELSHQLFYIKDATEFNESFAMLIEEEGVRRWLVHNENEQAWDGWLARRVRAEQFNQIVSLARENLMALYATDIDPAQMRAEKQLVMAQLKKSHERLRTQWGGHSSYEGWFAGPLNNAQLSSVATYTLLVPALRVLLSQSANDLAIFYQRVQEIGALPVEEREQILQKLGARSGH